MKSSDLLLVDYGTALDKIMPGLSGYTSGLQSATTASKGLIATPLGIFLGVVVALVSAFASTQEGMDKINSLLAPLKGGFQAFIGVVQDLAVNIFGQLGDRFTIASNKIQGGILLVRTAFNKLTGDEEKANQLADEFNVIREETLKAQERINQKTAAFSDILAGAGQRMKEGAETQSRIEKLTIAIERKQIDTTVALAKANNELRKNKQIAEDISKTEDERLKAHEKAVKFQEFITETEQDIIDMKIERLELEQSLNDTSREGEQELEQLKADRYDKETESIRLLTSLQSVRNTIVNQQNAAELKAIADKKAEEDKKTAEVLANAEKEAAAYIAQRQKVAATRDAIDKAEYDLHRLNELKAFEIEQQDRLDHGESIKNIMLAEVDFREKEQKELLKREAENRAIAIMNETGSAEEKNAKLKLLYAETQYELTLIEAEGIDERNRINKEALATRAQQFDGYVQQAGDILTGFIAEDIKKTEEQHDKKLEDTAAYYDAIIEEAKQNGEDTKIWEMVKADALKKINDDANKERNRLNKIQQDVQIAQALSGAALAVIMAFAQLGPIAGAIAAVAIGATTALNIKQIKSQKIPQYAKGGVFDPIGGKRHSQGGTKFFGEDGSVFEAESGEGIGILSRSQFAAFENFRGMLSGSSGGSMESGLGKKLDRLNSTLETKEFRSYAAVFENDPNKTFIRAEQLQSKRNR